MSGSLAVEDEEGSGRNQRKADKLVGAEWLLQIERGKSCNTMIVMTSWIVLSCVAS
jgi:hypothetical protein